MMSTKTWRGKTIASIGFTGLLLGAILVIGRNVQRGSSASAMDQITVVVSGEVMKPGPIQLPKGSTVEYLLLQARPKSTALLDGMDLSKVLAEGDRVSVPRKAKVVSSGPKTKVEVLDRLWAAELAKADVNLIAKMLGVEKGLASEINRLAQEKQTGRGTIRWATEILTHPNVLQERWNYPKWVNAARLYAESLQAKGLLPDTASKTENSSRNGIKTRD